MTVLIVVETAVLLVLSVLVVGLLRSYATVLQRLHRLDGGVDPAPPAPLASAGAAPPFRTADGVVGPPEGQEWPVGQDIAGVGLSGEVVTARTVGVQHDTVLVFLSSGCAGCAGFWEQLAAGGLPSVGTSRVLVVTKGPDEESVAQLSQLSPPGLDLVMSSAAWADHRVPGSPYVIVIDGVTGRIKGEGSGTSLSQVSALIRQAYGDGAWSPGRRGMVKPRSDADREVEVDRALLASGIDPGHPSLYLDIVDTSLPATADSPSAAGR